MSHGILSDTSELLSLAPEARPELEYDEGLALAQGLERAHVVPYIVSFTRDQIVRLTEYIESCFENIRRGTLREITEVILELDAIIGLYNSCATDQGQAKLPRLLDAMQLALKGQREHGSNLLGLRDKAAQVLETSLQAKFEHAFRIVQKQLRAKLGGMPLDDVVMTPFDIEDDASVHLVLTHHATTHMADLGMDGMVVKDKLDEVQAFGERTSRILGALEFSPSVRADDFALSDKADCVENWGILVLPEEYIAGVVEDIDTIDLDPLIEIIRGYEEYISDVQAALEFKILSGLMPINTTHPKNNVRFRVDLEDREAFYNRHIPLNSVLVRAQALHRRMGGLLTMPHEKIQRLIVTFGVRNDYEVDEDTLIITLSAKQTASLEDNLTTLKRVLDAHSVSMMV